MKFFAVFLAVALVASVSASPPPKTETPALRSVIDDILALQKCINVIAAAIQTATSDILTEIREVEALIGQYTEKATNCFKDISNDPTTPEQIQIANCLNGVYRAFAADLLGAIAKIEESLRILTNLPQDIEKCMTTRFLRNYL